MENPAIHDKITIIPMISASSARVPIRTMGENAEILWSTVIGSTTYCDSLSFIEGGVLFEDNREDRLLVQKARQILKRGDFIGFKESEMFISSILDASS